ncbi:MAG TPA: hypothetical protein VFU16_02425 [Solirubrobacterales bacterium]|nr:hypothetical protein [Solirubrobacterales bacterium]
MADDPESGGPENKGDAPVRVCPTCSAQSQTFADNCPHCGASFIRSRRRRAQRRIGGWSKRRKVAVLGLLAALVGVGVAVAVIAKVNHDNAVAEKHQEEQEQREQAQREKAEEEELIAEEVETEEELERIEVKYGRESVKELEDAITKDANSEAEEGFSEYVSKTSCEAEGGRIDPSRTAQNFNCLAVTSEGEGVEEGYRYSGTINYANGTLSWRLGGP